MPEAGVTYKVEDGSELEVDASHKYWTIRYPDGKEEYWALEGGVRVFKGTSTPQTRGSVN